MNINLAEKIEQVKQMSIEELCEKFNCQPEEICLGDYIARHTEDRVCPYKVILGFADFEKSKVFSLGNLEIVYGKKLADLAGPITDIQCLPVYLGINLKNSQISHLGNLKKVYGSITLNEYIKTLENLEFLGSNLYLNNTYVEDLGNLKQVHGRLNLENLKGNLTTLNKLEKAGTIFVDIKTLQDLGDLNKVQNIIYGKHCSYNVIKLFNTRFSRQKKMEEVSF